MKLKWLFNTQDPKRKSRLADPDRQRKRIEALEGKIIGKPQATEDYSVEQLSDMRIVGVYEIEKP